jgi:hypothetical protein
LTFPRLTVADGHRGIRGGAAVLEPHARQRPRCPAQEGPGHRQRTSQGDALCRDTS